MSESLIELNLRLLRKAALDLSLPAEQQAKLYPEQYNAAYEMADDYDNWATWALQPGVVTFSDRQRKLLESILTQLRAISCESEEAIWSIKGLVEDDRWAQIRDTAQELVDLSNWHAG